MITLISSNPVSNSDPPECGPMNINLDPFLGVVGQSSVTPCCKDHDECYGRCGATKQQCDDAFRQCVTNKCNGKPNHCKVLAEGFYTAVLVGGGKSYDNDQKRAGCTSQPSTHPLQQLFNKDNVKSAYNRIRNFI